VCKSCDIPSGHDKETTSDLRLAGRGHRITRFIEHSVKKNLVAVDYLMLTAPPATLIVDFLLIVRFKRAGFYRIHFMRLTTKISNRLE
jgi:hypothetical protein